MPSAPLPGMDHHDHAAPPDDSGHQDTRSVPSDVIVPCRGDDARRDTDAARLKLRLPIYSRSPSSLPARRSDRSAVRALALGAGSAMRTTTSRPGHAVRSRLGSLCLVALLYAALPSAARAQQESGPRDEHRALQLATAGSLLVTATLGTLTAINRPTLFSEGRCATGDPILGDYGCRGLNTLHGISALMSTVLYAATTTVELTAFDWPGRDRHDSAYEALSYVHLVGMSVQALGGVIAAMPEVIGARRDGAFARTLRTLHMFTGYIIVGSFGVTTAIEL